MINQQPSNVSIELSLPNRNRSRKYSDSEDGAGHRSSALWQMLTDRILDPNDDQPTIYFPMWDHKIFIVACSFAVLLDPLFCYLPILDEKNFCYYWDKSLMWPLLGLRSFLDLFYAMDIFVFLRRNICGKRNANMTVMASLLKLLPIIPRIYVALPISQATVLMGCCSSLDNYVLIVFFYPIQYTLRAYRTFGLIKQRPDIETGIGRWLQAILDFLPFLIASHLFGALWYYFAVERQLNCWLKAYTSEKQCSYEYNFYCDKTFSAIVNSVCNMTHLEVSCPINPEDKTKFDFGIYLYALQSNFTRSKYFPRKFLQSFWWGLRNLSSFGSNLQTSFYTLEIFFSVLISISGLALFLVYLNARVQVSQKRSNRIKLRQKMQMMNPDIDMWLSRNYLSEHKLLKKVIMKNVQQKLEENKDVDVQNFFTLVPIVHKRLIMSLPSLASLEKVPKFKNMNKRVLKAIAEHLEPVSYTKSCYIIREEEPLWNVLFITHGTALSYKTSTFADSGGCTSGSSIIQWLEKDDIFGDELLDWAFVFAPRSNLPVSPKTVMAQTRVEAFAISANNLERVVSKFRLHFSLNFPNLEHSPLEHKAASSLQAAWRANANRNTGWNRLRELFVSGSFEVTGV